MTDRVTIEAAAAAARAPGASASGSTATDRGEASGRARELERAGIEFEAVFLRQLMEEMLPDESAFFGSETGSKTFRGLFVDAVARQVATRGALGVREILRQGLERSYTTGEAGRPYEAAAALERAETRARLAARNGPGAIDFSITEKDET